MGEDRVTNDPMEAHYIGFHMWVNRDDGVYAKVPSDMGSDDIVQSFMTVVVGGVGNIWGTLLGATLVGTLRKGIEWLNPSNTLAAQTYMILFIILFIQFRLRGIIALKGRAAEA